MLILLCLALLIPRTGDGLVLHDIVWKNCSHIKDQQEHIKLNSNLLSQPECQPWFFNKTGECQPGPTLGGIIQQDLQTLQTSVLECYCMTEVGGVVAVGACIYTCNVVMGYYPLPCHVSQLENFTCEDLHRHGQLCGDCKDGYALPVYSYVLECVKCENYEYNWLKYLAAAFLPLTIFYILVAILSISFTAPLLSGLVMFFQTAAHPAQLQVLVSGINSHTVIAPKLLKALLSLASFWNLDFFRMYYSFCLHPKTSGMTILALDYATTVYPLVLIGITYVMVKLYDNNFKLVLRPWKMISVLLKPLKKNWNIRTSLVDVFASFIYLSSNRLLITSTSLLVPIPSYTYQQQGHNIHVNKTYYLLYSPSVEYFGKEHLPFALMAIALSFMFFILPMILLFVYPFSCFQKALNSIGLNSVTLHTFMEVYQGFFKNGTNNTRDCRYFSGFLFLYPLVINLTFALTIYSMYYPIGSLWVVLYLVLHLVLQPYKHIRHNYITIAMLVAMLAYFWGVSLNSEIFSTTEHGGNNYRFHEFLIISLILIALSVFLPILYIFGLICLLFFLIVNIIIRKMLKKL